MSTPLPLLARLLLAAWLICCLVAGCGGMLGTGWALEALLPDPLAPGIVHDGDRTVITWASPRDALRQGNPLVALGAGVGAALATAVLPLAVLSPRAFLAGIAHVLTHPKAWFIGGLTLFAPAFGLLAGWESPHAISQTPNGVVLHLALRDVASPRIVKVYTRGRSGSITVEGHRPFKVWLPEASLPMQAEIFEALRAPHSTP